MLQKSGSLVQQWGLLGLWRLTELVWFFSSGIIVKRPFFDPLREEALYDDGEFWEVSVCLETEIIW